MPCIHIIHHLSHVYPTFYRSSSSNDVNFALFLIDSSSFLSSSALDFTALFPFAAPFLALSSSVSGLPSPGGGSQVTSPVLAASSRFRWPSSPARPRTPAMTCIHLKLCVERLALSYAFRSCSSSGTYLSSFAGIGYVTQVGSASVSITPIVGMLLSPHSCNKT